MSTTIACTVGNETRAASWLRKVNGPWHKPALQIFLVIVLAHWAEHLAQAAQIYILHWPVVDSRGFLGHWYPWLVKSEFLHYAYAIVMLVGLWIFRLGFVGRSRVWWMIAFWIQFWHHIEHAILQGQGILGQNLFASPVPVSIVQLWIPRVELHLIYNTIVFVPMMIAMFNHMFPTAQEEAHHHCGCAWHPRVAMA